MSERAPALSSDGTGLLLWPDVLRALDALGLGERLRRLAVPQPPGTLRRDDGRVLARVDPERVRRRVGDVPHVVARPDLLSVLFEALPEATVRFGVTAPVEPDADVLVGADGARSAVRRRLLGVRYGLRETGTTAWRVVVDAVTLARCLTGVSGSEDVAAALRDYDRARRRPSQRIAAAALWTGRISTARHGAGVRDLLVRAAAALAG